MFYTVAARKPVNKAQNKNTTIFTYIVVCIRRFKYISHYCIMYCIHVYVVAPRRIPAESYKYRHMRYIIIQLRQGPGSRPIRVPIPIQVIIFCLNVSL